MQQFIIAFVTGLTTGGLSCLAVQGGLLANSLAHQLELDILEERNRRRKQRFRPTVAFPIVLFLSAKVVAYTGLGLLLGVLGSVLTLNPTIRAILLIAIGIFMLGNALRMLTNHPFFRFFTIEPPKLITRYIRKTAKGTDWLTPVFLGGLTVLIPCGVTQAMMAVALATGDAIQGAALMFAFTLGTSPVFFLVAYLTTRIGARLEKWFMRFVAIVVLVLGLISVNSGFAIAGYPAISWNRVGTIPSVAQTQITDPSTDVNNLILYAENYGYTPAHIEAPANTQLILNVVTNNTFSCSRAFLIPTLGVEVILPETGTVQIEIPAQPAGTVLPFTCSMGMYTGVINFEEPSG